MANKRRIEIVLEDNEVEFLKWLAKNDNISVQEEMRQLFYLQLREEMELYEEEAKNDNLQRRFTET